MFDLVIAVEIISFSAPAHIKDLLRLRAAVRRISLSAFVRELVLRQIPDPTPDERLFLPWSDSQVEHTVHVQNGDRSGNTTLFAEDDREPDPLV